MSVIRFICLICAVFICASILFFCSPPARSEIFRISNPNNTFAAVNAEVETGATVGTINEIYLVKQGEKISGNYIFAADKVENLKLIWLEPDILVIQASEARIFFFEKSKSIKLQNQEITIKLDIKKIIPDY